MSLHLIFSYDKGVSYPGVRNLVDFLQTSSEKPTLCLIDEPTEMQPVLGHKDKLVIHCYTKGQVRHSAYTPQEANVIRYAVRLVNHLDRLDMRLVRQQNGRFSSLFSMLQVGTIQGGAALNIVPQSCHFDFKIRHLLGMRSEAVTEALAVYTRHQLPLEIHQVGSGSNIQLQLLSHYSPLPNDSQFDFARRLAQRCGSDHFFTVAFGTEGELLDEMNVVTLVRGPGSMVQGHKVDECISIAQTERCMTMLQQLCAWTRAEPAEPFT